MWTTFGPLVQGVFYGIKRVMNRPDLQMKIRLSSQLKALIEERAKAHSVSLNAEVISLLEMSLGLKDKYEVKDLFHKETKGELSDRIWSLKNHSDRKEKEILSLSLELNDATDKIKTLLLNKISELSIKKREFDIEISILEDRILNDDFRRPSDEISMNDGRIDLEAPKRAVNYAQEWAKIERGPDGKIKPAALMRELVKISRDSGRTDFKIAAFAMLLAGLWPNVDDVEWLVRDAMVGYPPRPSFPF